MNFIKCSVQSSCTLEVYSWSGFFPMTSYLRLCVSGMFCLLLLAKWRYGESRVTQIETLLCTVL